MSVAVRWTVITLSQRCAVENATFASHIYDGKFALHAE